MIMRYKGYIAQVTFDEQARIFHGEIVNLKSIITFQGTSVDELEQEIKNSVEDYLQWCKESDEKPDKPYSGNLKLRMPSELHANLAQQANIRNISLNSLILEKLNNNIEVGLNNKSAKNGK